MDRSLSIVSRVYLYDYQDYGPRLQAYPFHLNLSELCFILAKKRDLAAKIRYGSNFQKLI